MGDGYYYEPTQPKEKKSKHVEEWEKIFEEALGRKIEN